jgi:hypothetical protein
MLFEAIDVLRPDDLLVLDRGFPSRWLVSVLTARGIPFYMRCDNSGGFKAVRCFLASGLAEKVVSLGPPNARLTMTPSGADLGAIDSRGDA